MVSELSPEAYDTLRVLKRTPDGIPEDNLPPGITVELLDFLVSEGYVRRLMLEPPSALRPFGVVGYDLSSKGHNALLAAEERYNREAKQEREKYRKAALENIRWRKDARRSWVQWTITTVVAFLSFFSGAVVEKFTGFVEWILRWFQ